MRLIFIVQFSTYDDIKNIIDKALPRVIYLPLYIARRVGHEVYINLFPHERFQCQRRLINDEQVSRLPIDEYDFLLSLISLAKEKESYIKLRGKYLAMDDIIKEYRYMGYTKTKVTRYMEKLIKDGYIEEVFDGEQIKYKFTDKAILPERPELKFKVFSTNLEGLQC